MASSSLLAAARRRGGLLPVPPSRAVASSSRSNSTEEGPPSLQSTLWPMRVLEQLAARPGNRLRDADPPKHRQGAAHAPLPPPGSREGINLDGTIPVFVWMVVSCHCSRGAGAAIPVFGTARGAGATPSTRFFGTAPPPKIAQVSEWMNLKGHVKFLPKDHAIHLDLIGHVHGAAAAETYFNNLSDKHKTDKPYGALLNCYTRERLVDKALAHFQKMKELGFVFGPLPYNNLMSLYTNTGQHEKVPLLMAEMKSNGIVPDNFSYRICINSYGTRADFLGLEKTLEEMECEPQLVVDWNTYAAVASQYIKGDLREKAYSALQKAEAKMGKEDLDAYRQLISLYGHLGDRSEVKRLWALQMSNCNKRYTKDYSIMLAVLVKLDEVTMTEDLLKEWESSNNAFDFHVLNVLLTWYCRKGLLDKAEALLEGFLIKGNMPPSTSWSIVAAGYAGKGDVAKAYELTKHALYTYAPGCGWIPAPSMIEMILQYLGEGGGGGGQGCRGFHWSAEICCANGL